MKAADIMTTNVVTIDSLATIDRATKVMKQHDVKTLIVDRASDKDAYGIITATDISYAIANTKDPASTYVCEVMTKPCIVVNPNLAVEHIANLFSKAKIRIAPVIQDRLLGVVSITDILTKTDCLTLDKAKFKANKTLASGQFADKAIENDWEIADWETEYDNWCSG
ncbi:CBS domain-containing protein [Pleurocapsales cyanobacterium LEGE 10410]|nr:CBS domain-containing protein [Pleurocapsales cyanobacterium LEGE 10410]